MAIIGKHDHAPQLTVDHAAFADIARQHRELLPVAAPVDRQQRTAAVDRLVLARRLPSLSNKETMPGFLQKFDCH